MNRFAAAPLALVLAAFGVASCGGGGDAPSKAEFAADANKICAEAEQGLKDLNKSTTPDELADALDKGIDQTQKSVDKLKDLDRPDGAAGETADKFVSALETQIQDKGIPVLEDLRDAIKKNDQKAAQDAYQRLQKIETADANKFARQLGAKGCAD
jgi:hypothetical protein